MASINSSNNTTSAVASNIYSALSAKNKGIGGLATGLDTDSLIQALTSGTASKITSQSQKKTLLNWKMTAYRGVATTLRAFQTQHFDRLRANASTAIINNAFFNVFKGTSTSDKVTVTPGSGSTTGKITIKEISQLAESKQITSEVTGQKLELKENISDLVGKDYAGKTLRLDFNGAVRTIKLDDLSGANAGNFASTLQGLINTQFGADSGISVENNGGTLEIKGGSGTIYVASNCDALGLSEGMSNKVTLTSKLSDLTFFQGLNRDDFSFSINGVTITANKDETLSKVISRINSSTAGVKVNYQAHTDTFTIVANNSGSGNTIDMKDVEGNFLNIMFGAQGGSSLSSGTLYANQNVNQLGTSMPIYSSLDLTKTTLKVTYGSTTATINLDYSKYQTEIDELEAQNGTMSETEKVAYAINRQVAALLGDKAASEMTFYAGTGLSTGTVGFSTTATASKVALAAGSTADGGVDALTVFGLAEKTGAITTLGYKEKVESTLTFADDEALITYFEAMKDKSAKMLVTINGVEKEISFTLDDANLNNVRPALPAQFAAAPDDWDEAVDGEWTYDMGYAALVAAANDPANTDQVADQERLQNYQTQYAKNIREGMASALNSTVAKEFGSSPGITFSMTEDGIVVKGGTDVAFSLAASTVGTGEIDLFGNLGFTGAVANYAPGQGTQLADIGTIQAGQSFTIAVGSTSKTYTVGQNGINSLYDLMTAVNNDFRTQLYGEDLMKVSGGKIVLDAGDQAFKAQDNAGGSVLQNLVKTGFYETSAENYGSRVTEGKNAIITLGDGTQMVSTSNKFTVNGVDFEVNGTLFTTDADYKEITLNVTTDPGDVIDKIKTFVEEYNVLIKALQDMISEEQKRDYPPLTDEQKAEMSESEIKAWETEAKKGLLRNDATLRQIVNNMRGCLYKQVEAAGLSLYDVGITTASLTSSTGSVDLAKTGQLVVDEDKLRRVLEQNPDAVRTLFTDDDGISNRLNKIIDDAARTTSTNQGTLVSLAGTETLTGKNDSYLSRQIDSIDRYISTLKLRLENEYNRYWKKFSALETAISNLNTQSGWLAEFSNS